MYSNWLTPLRHSSRLNRTLLRWALCPSQAAPAVFQDRNIRLIQHRLYRFRKLLNLIPHHLVVHRLRDLRFDFTERFRFTETIL